MVVVQCIYNDSLIPRPINKGLVTRNRIPWFRLQKNAVTDQNRDNKNTKCNKIHVGVAIIIIS